MKIKELFRRDKNVCEIEKPKTNMKLRDFLKVAGFIPATNKDGKPVSN
ncbi:MAG TPA: hypothetical protein PKL53_05005 [Methylotenera sp.]|nr:hypothetical protein [Methylotenera sp.]HPV45910.1 hypothetical protein [Methylotenera sp.]